MVNIRRMIYRMFSLCCLLILLVLVTERCCYSQAKISAYPNEMHPSEIKIENDSLLISLSLDWKLTVS